MTIDEAIRHCREVAEENQAIVDACDYYGDNMEKCEECAKEHKQLAKWLEELKALKEQTNEDCISRKAVMDIDFNCIYATCAKPNEMIRQKIAEMPSVTPQPKTEQQPCELLILRTNLLLRKNDFKEWEESIKRGKEEGLIILPSYFEPILVPNDVEIRIEQEPKTESEGKQ